MSAGSPKPAAAAAGGGGGAAAGIAEQVPLLLYWKDTGQLLQLLMVSMLCGGRGVLGKAAAMS